MSLFLSGVAGDNLDVAFPYSARAMGVALAYQFATVPGASYPNRAMLLRRGASDASEFSFYLMASSAGLTLGWTSATSTYREVEFSASHDTTFWHTVVVSADWLRQRYRIWIDGKPLTITSDGSAGTTPQNNGTIAGIHPLSGTSDSFFGNAAELVVLPDATFSTEDAKMYAATRNGRLLSTGRRAVYVAMRSRAPRDENTKVAVAATGTATLARHPAVLSPLFARKTSSPFLFLPTLPGITVTGNGNSISDGDTTPDAADHTDFGSTAISSTVSRSFTVTNSGSSDLVISSVGLSGSGAGQFTVTANPTGTITAGNNATLTIRADAGSAGTHTATVTINSDAPGSLAAFTFDIQVVVRSSRVVLVMQNHGAFI